MNEHHTTHNDWSTQYNDEPPKKVGPFLLAWGSLLFLLLCLMGFALVLIERGI